jgi:hypothetical protein
MAETLVLRSSAINRNPSGGTPPAQLSGPLPVVQVMMTGNGPQLQGGQAAQPKAAKRSMSSSLPMVQVTMTGNGPQLAGSQTRAAATTAPQKRPASSLPMVQVKMTTGGPQVERGAVAAPGPSNQPRIVAHAQPRQTWQASPEASPQASQTWQAPQVPQAPQASDPLTADQLLLCRHLTDKYLAELRVGAGEAQAEGSVADNVKLAEATISAIDVAMIALTTAEAAALVAQETIAVAPPPAAPPPRVIVGPPPTVPPQRVVVGPRSIQGNSSMAPRRVARPAPLPIIDVQQSPEQSEPIDDQD